MLSQLIIAPPYEAKRFADSIAPFPIRPEADCLIVESETTLKIAQIRQIKHFLSRKPHTKNHQIVYIPGAHTLTIPAQNALLKTLEEPPQHACIILATQFPDRLLPTILSRCLVHRPISKPGPASPSNIPTLLSDIKNSSPGQKITLAGQWAYPREKALNLCRDIIVHYHTQLIDNPSPANTANATLTQETITYLEANTDPKLCIEHLFLNLV